ncbi:hypothetical protein ACQYAD_10845 [Neobacillus sp. SM06]|uniref:hypothetical protein n=1 Tax=Neobacillus sp. SM06 TaxID=3422492 RepID=UPI003D2B1B53
MFQMIIDFSDINALNALYISISIGISLKYIWAWSVEDTFIGSISNPANANVIQPHFLYKKKSRLNANVILIRIVMYIRRKKCTQDDAEEPISFLFI